MPRGSNKQTAGSAAADTAAGYDAAGLALGDQAMPIHSPPSPCSSGKGGGSPGPHPKCVPRTPDEEGGGPIGSGSADLVEDAAMTSPAFGSAEESAAESTPNPGRAAGSPAAQPPPTAAGSSAAGESPLHGAMRRARRLAQPIQRGAVAKAKPRNFSRSGSLAATLGTAAAMTWAGR